MMKKLMILICIQLLAMSLARAQAVLHFQNEEIRQNVPQDLYQQALEIYQANQDAIVRKEVLTIIDFGRSSAEERMFIIDLVNGKVSALHVAHGRGSDPDHDGRAQKFSNLPESNMSSLGAYLTAESYSGKHGASLRLDGMSEENSNARDRAIVIHGASYVSDTHRVQGRSLGCPAVSNEQIQNVLHAVGGGSLIFAGVSKIDPR